MDKIKSAYPHIQIAAVVLTCAFLVWGKIAGQGAAEERAKSESEALEEVQDTLDALTSSIARIEGATTERFSQMDNRINLFQAKFDAHHERQKEVNDDFRGRIITAEGRITSERSFRGRNSDKIAVLERIVLTELPTQPNGGE